MQILVPFFTTFRYYNPEAKLLFCTNLKAHELPAFLTELFMKQSVEIKTLPYTCKPPKGWYNAWMSQYYLYDILIEMERRMEARDTLIVSDADCLCRRSLTPLFDEVERKGSAFYTIGYPRDYVLNGTSIEQMKAVYQGCYGESKTLHYLGGEFIALRGDMVKQVNKEFSVLSQYNFTLGQGVPRLHEEAHNMSVIAARLNISNDLANKYVKRMWTARRCNNIVPSDEQLSVWHMPAEKKTGFYRLFRYLRRRGGISDEKAFWHKAGAWCGVPRISTSKKMMDLCLKAGAKIRQKLGL